MSDPRNETDPLPNGWTCPEPEWTPTYTLDKQLGRGRMSQTDWQELQDDWDETERLIGEAQKRYASHHNRALFKLECRRAIKRED